MPANSAFIHQIASNVRRALCARQWSIRSVCGILFSSVASISREQFVAALALMRHRGPDAPLCYARHGDAQLGHNRLKILDLDARSNQPFYSSDGRYAIIFNGEIYNYRELAAQHDIPQRTTSDTEVLLELYRRFGTKMLALLNGMFAFVILDTATGETFVARDRMGIKPLYMAEVKGGIILASEIAAVLELTGDSRLDPIGWRQHAKLRTCFNGRTLYAGIRMFPAGHSMLNSQLTRWWDLPEGEQAPPSDEELRELVRSAIAYRCISDVPVGSFLSGGLDSTIVAGVARNSHTWTVGFADDNEFPWSRMAAEQFGSCHTEVVVQPEEFVETARWMVRQRREPLSVPNEVLLYKMNAAVKEHNTVVLSGEGADELMFGYDRIFRWAAAAPAFDLEQFTQLYAYGSQPDYEIVEEAIAPFRRRGGALAVVAAFFQVAHLHGLLRRLDNASMLCAVEARVPFVDYRLVERMAGVPVAWRMADGVVKAPLKRAFADVVPAPIIARKKVGFPVPLARIDFGATSGSPMDNWLQFNLKEFAGREARAAAGVAPA